VKKILIIAGPNGARKTTFAEEFLPKEADCPEFVNADLIAAGLSTFQPEQVAIAAGRLNLKRIADLVAARKSFAFETTLSTCGYVRRISQWRRIGYLVKLPFLTLPDPEFAIRRVERRIRFGGHDIPAATIRRRFHRSLENLRNHYHGIAGESPSKLMDDPTECCSTPRKPRTVKRLDDPDFFGADAALKRASAKAVARDRVAGLEPVIAATEKQEYERDEFYCSRDLRRRLRHSSIRSCAGRCAPTNNIRLNVLQHIDSELKICHGVPGGGTAAVVLPGNVLFFERKATREKAWTQDLLICDLRINQHFCLPLSGSAERLRLHGCAANAAGQSLKTNPLANKDLDHFKAVYQPGKFAKRKETDRFKKFTYTKIVESLEAALAEFRSVEEALVGETDN
jgi:predicted ABC-type ATPase